MALSLLTTTAFEKDLKRVGRQGRNLDKLEAIVTLLQTQQPLPTRCRPHNLRGNWTETELILVRTGSHAELFE